jgi:hypothetical protein
MQKAIQMTGPRMANGVAPSVVEVIGDTPTAELSRLTGGSTGRIVAKPDYLNPGFSRKDRIARQIIEDGVVSGALEPGSAAHPMSRACSGCSGPARSSLSVTPGAASAPACSPTSGARRDRVPSARLSTSGKRPVRRRLARERCWPSTRRGSAGCRAAMTGCPEHSTVAATVGPEAQRAEPARGRFTGRALSLGPSPRRRGPCRAPWTRRRRIAAELGHPSASIPPRPAAHAAAV